MLSARGLLARQIFAMSDDIAARARKIGASMSLPPA
jgi:hypothetical protein